MTTWRSLFPLRSAGLSAGLLLLWLADFHFDVRGRDAFTWMDPSQYFHFAYDVLHGVRAVGEFEVASIFPLLVVPFLAVAPSIPGAFLVQAAAMLVLVWAVYDIARLIGLRTPRWVIAACLLASPLLIGLSRSLYSELALAAWTAVTFALWLRTDGFSSRRATLLLSICIGTGFLLKVTFPVFLAGACAVEAVWAWCDRRWRPLVTAVLTVAVPIALAILVLFLFFPIPFEYIRNRANTAIPITHLIGPVGIGSVEALTYYGVQSARTLFLLLTPLLVLPAIATLRHRPASRPVWILWSWLLVPLVVFTFQEIKEPRHVAPCVAPGILLLAWGIESVFASRGRRVAWGLAAAAAVAQYLAVTLHRLDTPYFLDRPSFVTQVLDRCAETTGPSGDAAPAGFNDPGWRYTHTIGLHGFEPNMALLYAWVFHPGIVVDLDQVEDPRNRPLARNRFEDLFLMNGFNLYNRRCLWYRTLPTVDKETVFRELDALVVRAGGVAPGFRPPDGYEAVDPGPGIPTDIRIFRNPRAPRRSLRVPYAMRHLTGDAPLSDADRAAAGFEVLMASVLRDDFETIARLSGMMPYPVALGEGRRNVYWTGVYGQVFERARARLAAMTEPAP